MCIFEAAKTGKNQFWMVQTSPSVWKRRKWIRAWRKLLVLGSCMGSLAKTYTTAISSACTFFAKTIKYKMRKIEMREICWNHFEIFLSQRQIRFALSQICVREVISGISKDQREVRQVRRTNRLQGSESKFRTLKNCKTMDWVDYLDNLKL